VEPHQYKLSAVASSEAKLIAIDAAKMRAFLAERPEWGYQLMQQLSRVIGTRLDNMRTRLISMAG
jgi:CRP-like cAMP-binding protein